MRLYELAKMDGAIVVSPNISTIHYANVHLSPDPGYESDETGMRHLAADRTAQQTGSLVIAVSERRRVVSLYQGSYGSARPRRYRGRPLEGQLGHRHAREVHPEAARGGAGA